MKPCGCSLRYDWVDSFQLFATKTHHYRQILNIPKLSEEDTTLIVGNAAGEKLTIPVLKGVRISIDAAGLHYNRRRIFDWEYLAF